MRDFIQGTGPQADRGLRALVGIGVAILVIVALFLARPVFAPLTFALFIIAIVWPVQAGLQKRLPKLLALAISILATVIVIGSLGWVVTWGFARVARRIAADSGQFQLLYTRAAEWLEGHGIVIAGLWAEHFNTGWLIRGLQEVTTWVNGTLSFSIVVLIYVILGLLEVDLMARKLRAMQGQAGRVLVDGGARTALKLRRYMMVRTLMSVITGVLVWAFVSLCGLPLATEWGVIAFVLNYIPFLGPLIATVLPTLFAVAQFETLQAAILVFACLNLIQFLVGSYLEPLIAGKILSMSPFLVLFAIFFWTFLWGIAGAFIGIPIVIALLTLCEQHESSRWVAQLLGSAGER